MESRRAFIRWFIIGVATAGLVMFAEASNSFGAAGLLRVGDESIVRPLIESELGDIPLSDGNGHDGQYFYTVGIDLTGSTMSALDDEWAYRYRRILYPATASIFGLLDGYALLYSMMIVNLVSTGVAAGAVAAISVKHRKSEWLALVVILNPGVWLSAALLTTDVFALALMTIALMAFLYRRGGRAVSTFVLSVLAKETFLMTPAGLAFSRDRRRWKLVLAPLAALVLWTLVVQLLVGNALAARDNLGLPFAGMIDAARVWGEHNLTDQFFTAFSLLSVVVGSVVVVVRKGWLRWSLLAWCALGVISSYLVWRDGNNSVRVFIALPILIALAFGEPEPSPRAASPLPTP